MKLATDNAHEALRRPRGGLHAVSNKMTRCAALTLACVTSGALPTAHAMTSHAESMVLAEDLSVNPGVDGSSSSSAGGRRGALWADPEDDQVVSEVSMPVSASSACSKGMFMGYSPWWTLDCWKASRLPTHDHLSFVRTNPVLDPVDDVDRVILPLVEMKLSTLLAVMIFIFSVLFGVGIIRDVHRFIMVLAMHTFEGSRTPIKDPFPEDTKIIDGRVACPFPSPEKAPEAGTGECSGGPTEENQRWSLLGLMGLMGLRFYTGFLSATWLPYLLAMEGQDLFREKQALFMALAKLIYGATILLNPLFGLVGDQATALSHAVGRRLSLRAGGTLAALGIYLCVLSGRDRVFLTFLSGIFVWRLGEALMDVTTEALIPEMVPKEQFQMASAIKAVMFFFGGLFGYAVLIIFSDYRWNWLYYAYPLGLFLCITPSLIMLNRDRPGPPVPRKPAAEQDGAGPRDMLSFQDSLVQAYVVPARYSGGFPLACAGAFLFALGTSPMFFLLLIVRDVVGISDPAQAQRNFSWGSIGFFLAAAVASVLQGLVDPVKRKRGLSKEEQSSDVEVLHHRGRLLCISMVTCGVVECLLPCLPLLQTTSSRLRAFYFLTPLFGATFGVTFSVFQDLMWQMLPAGANTANAMGFGTMSRLLGIGLGNFVCGLILDLSYSGRQNIFGDEIYALSGYIIMCTVSGVLMCIASVVGNASVQKAIKLVEHKACARPVAQSP